VEAPDYLRMLRKAGFPDPPGTVVKVRFVTGHADWYAETEQGWFWWNGKEWRHCPYGPNPI
jgi:hypothetical protein